MYNRIKILLFLILFSCNTEKSCFDYIGYETADTCLLTIASYSTASDEDKAKLNFPILLAICLDQIEQINDCKREPSKWPIPNEVVD
jgi:hypothetical protein